VPYLRDGILWRDYQRLGVAGPAHLVWHAPTTFMRPDTAEDVAAGYAKDHEYARRYFGAEFVDSVSAFLPHAAVRACVVDGRADVPKKHGVYRVAAVDPSGLTENDAWTMCVARLEGDRIVVEALRAYDGTSDDEVVGGHASLLRAYGLDAVCSDRYAGSLPGQRYMSVGIRCSRAPMDKSEAYLEAEKVIRQGRAELPDDAALIRELTSLERKYMERGRVSVDHPKNRHDDRANAVCLAVALCEPTRLRRMAEDALDDEDDRPDPDREQRAVRLAELMRRAVDAGHDPAPLQARSEQAGDDPESVRRLCAEIEEWLASVWPDTLRDRMRRGRISMEELSEDAEESWWDASQPR
jgi:hypothetical protein